ncbi:hypothetical protein KJ713_02115 [Patescibacteria group bacterium]|nr:hypothetical protein [Patescibacteria group bacterium]
MNKQKNDEDADSLDLSEMEEKAKKRERKKRKRMDISGKNVFKIKELKDKQEKDLSKDEE